jgi:hypothetical protein
MTERKIRELAEEFRLVLSGRSNILDSLVPPILFVLLNALAGLSWAMWGSVAAAVTITLFRLSRGEPIRNGLGGLGGTIIAVVLTWLLGRAEGYFIPSIVSGAGTTLVCILSVLAGRPMVAWTSHLARGWPFGWYWHPRVRPAYSEVTWMWALFFALRMALQLALLRGAAPGSLAIANVVMGWPATIVLLAVSYLYGTWRLRVLQGPSVEEYRGGFGAPWKGQHRGF